MKDYTAEDFINSFLNDRMILGEEAQYIYEDIFSAILEKDVNLDSFTEEVETAEKQAVLCILEDAKQYDGIISEEDSNEILELLDEDSWISKIHDKWESIVNPYGAKYSITGKLKNPVHVWNAAHPEDKITLLDRLAQGPIGGFFKKIKGKFKDFFGQFKGKSFGEILKGGVSWLFDPTNLAKVLSTAGGVVLVATIMKGLKKRKKMREYNRLRNEAANIELSDDIKEAYEDVLHACNTNKKLGKLMFEETHCRKDDYFGY